MRKQIVGLFCLCVFGLLAAGVGSADTILLNVSGCTAGCGPDNPFATVTLTQFGSGTSAYVQVDESLGPNEVFSISAGKEALEFNVEGAGTISITNINDTTDFGVVAGPYTAAPFGTFLDAVGCTTCSGGSSNNDAGPLMFDVSSASGVTIADFDNLSTLPPGGTQAYFASDIAYINPITGATSTGDVGATSFTQTPVIPEPPSLVLLGTGLLLLAGAFKAKMLLA